MLVEKVDLRSLFGPVCANYAVPIANAKGWSDTAAPAATAAWEDGGRIPAERSDPYLRQAFRDVEVLEPGVLLPGGEGFASLAKKVYEPYLLARVVRT